MQRDRQQPTAFKSTRDQERREWARSGSEQHQREAREHSRQTAKLQRTHALLADAERQIRELRSH